MILHNDIWGDTSVTLIEEIDNQFLIGIMGTVPAFRR